MFKNNDLSTNDFSSSTCDSVNYFKEMMFGMYLTTLTKNEETRKLIEQSEINLGEI